MEMTVKYFCDKHFLACTEGRDWALATGCATMQELWLRDDMRYEWRMWIIRRDGVLTRNELLRFACWSVRQVWHLLTDERSKATIEVVERFIERKATVAEVRLARDAAYAAYTATTTTATAAYATYAYAAACTVGAATAEAAAYAAAYASTDTARASQARWLIENTKPNFAGRE